MRQSKNSRKNSKANLSMEQVYIMKNASSPGNSEQYFEPRFLPVYVPSKLATESVE